MFFKKKFTVEVAENIIKSIINAEDRPSFKEMYSLFDMFEDKNLVVFLEFQLLLADMVIFTKISKNASSIFRSKLFGEQYTITIENTIQHISFNPENFEYLFDSYFKFKDNLKMQKPITEILIDFNDFLQPMVKDFMFSSNFDLISGSLIMTDFISMQNSIEHNLYKKIKNYE